MQRQLRWLGLGCVLVTLGPACIPLSADNGCRDDVECATGEICTDVRECSLADRAPSWRVAWTLNGTAPVDDPSACDAIDELELTITSNTESLNYAPLACSTGSFAFRALPTSFNTVRLEAFLADGGQAVGRATVNRSQEPEVTVDLEF